MTWLDLPLRNVRKCCFSRKIINNILIKVWLSQSNYHMAAGSEQWRAQGIILSLQGLEEDRVITIDKANLPVF